MSFCFIEKVVDDTGLSMSYYHSHSHHEIYFLLKGTRKIYIENNFYDADKNCIAFFPPNTLHKTEGEPFTRINVNVDTEYLDAFQQSVLDVGSHQMVKVEPSEMQNVLQILNFMLTTQESETNTHEKDYKIGVLFSYLIFYISKLQHFPKAKPSKGNKNISVLAKKTLHYITENYDKHITLDDLAAQFFVSKVTLCKDFKKAMNTSIADYLLNIKLSKAKDYLTHTNKKINEIAELCGFSSQNYFSLIFKQKEKMSPLHYRQYWTT